MINDLWNSLNHKYGVFSAKYFLNGYCGEKTIETNGSIETVIMFKADNMMGMSLLNGQIMLNEKLLEDDAELARKLIINHEKGHRQENPIFSLLAGFSQIILRPAGLLLGLLLLNFLVLAPLTGFYITQGFSPQRGVIGVLSVYFAAATISYIGEVRADSFAIEELGLENFLEADSQAKELWEDKSKIRNIAIRASHPPAWLTAQIYREIRSS